MANRVNVDLDVKNSQLLQETKRILENTNSRINGLEESFRRLEKSLIPLLRNGICPRPPGRPFSIPDEGTKLFCLKPITQLDAINFQLDACGAKDIIGGGGFGTVLRGKLNGQDVAVKVLKLNGQVAAADVLNQGTKKANEELIHELLTMHCYPSENILQLITYCLSPPCLIFPFMENGCLDTKLRDTNRPLSWKHRANIALGIARGLHHLHGNSIVHGDIKSTNILLDKHLEPKIGDFGTVKLLYNAEGKETTCLTLKMPVHGTKYYLPEWYIQGVNQKKVRKAVDIYSFGIVILEIMSGKLPSDKDAHQCTLRDFVDKQINNKQMTDKQISPAPPNEYIAQVDDEHVSFEVSTTTGMITVHWPQVFYDIGVECLRWPYDPKVECHSTPWIHMPTIEQLHQEINTFNSYYLRQLEEASMITISSRLLSSMNIA